MGAGRNEEVYICKKTGVRQLLVSTGYAMSYPKLGLQALGAEEVIASNRPIMPMGPRNGPGCQHRVGHPSQAMADVTSLTREVSKQQQVKTMECSTARKLSRTILRATGPLTDEEAP